MSLRIAILAHGNMDIPAAGWGAVESLIWEYYKGLTAAGHNVTIINTQKTNVMVEYINAHNWDYIHIHNDILINIVPRLLHEGLIIFTSHYPCINNPSVWKDSISGYDYLEFIMTPLLLQMQTDDRLHVGALSEKDFDAFEKFQIPKTKLMLMKNGMPVEKYHLEAIPLFPERIICLAQICDRKRQYLLTNIPEVWFAGPVIDTNCLSWWDDKHPRNLGEMREEKYDLLTHFGGAVLLSEYENGTPLAIKEALAAGLGVVVSDGVAHELKKSDGSPLWPWVTIIPEDKVHDTDFVALKIKENVALSLPLREQIRKEAKDIWDWPLLIHLYSKEINRFLAAK